MIRFILKRKIKDITSTLYSEHFETLDVDCAELEDKLLRGGCGEDSFDHTELISVEIIQAEQKVSDGN